MAVLLGVRELPREGREALTTPALLGGSHAPSDTGMREPVLKGELGQRGRPGARVPVGFLRAASGMATVAPGGPHPEASGQSLCWQEAPGQEGGGAAGSCFPLLLLGWRCPCEKDSPQLPTSPQPGPAHPGPLTPSPARCGLGLVSFSLWASGVFLDAASGM